MAHFAKINKETKIVEQVVVATQAWVYSQPDSEDYVQTSYNGNFRKRYAGIGYTYNQEIDAFVAPKPFPSWTLNETTAEWEAPSPRPEGNPELGFERVWNENDLKWEDIPLPTTQE